MRRLFLELFESVRIAVTQIRANKMRSGLTALGVVIGIVAVTLMVTAIKGIDKGIDFVDSATPGSRSAARPDTTSESAATAEGGTDEDSQAGT